MSEPLINIVSALGVSLVITLMSKLHSQRLKAILYVLPIPITIALIGSDSTATSLSLAGLVLTAGFLWGCYLLHTRYGLNILLTDVLLAVLYVIVGYILAQNVSVAFWPMFTAYLIVWIAFMCLFRNRVFAYRSRKPVQTNAILKIFTIFIIAFVLFSTHQYLAAFVVTFPYNGVFAVYENRFGLLPQAALLTRNSIAIACYFAANYLTAQQPDIIRYAVSWITFGIVLVLVSWLIKVNLKDLNNHKVT